MDCDRANAALDCLEAFIGLVTAFDVKADLLVSMALIASVSIGEDFAAGEVAFIMQIGALLEDLTVAKARAGIEKLVRLTPRTARVLRGGAEEIIAAEAVMAGDVIRVLPGETIPADGIVLDGQTSVDQSVMTGEPMPVDKGPGDEVASGTVNQYGGFTMRASRAGEDSSFQRMVRLVQSARRGQGEDSAPRDRWATWIVAARAELGARRLALHRRGDTRRHDSRRLLPLRARARNAYRNHGGGGQLHKVRRPRARGRRA